MSDRYLKKCETRGKISELDWAGVKEAQVCNFQQQTSKTTKV